MKMKYLILTVILCVSMTRAGDLTIDGNLNVTNNVTIPTGKLVVGTNAYSDQWFAPMTTLNGGAAFINKYGTPTVSYNPEGYGGSGALGLFENCSLDLWGNTSINSINQGLRLNGSHPWGKYISFYSKTNAAPDMMLTNGTLVLNGDLVGKGQVRIVPQGDLSMGAFTNSPPVP
jgi:hypothetical protein